MKYSTLVESSPEQKTLFWPHEFTKGGVLQGVRLFLIPVLEYLCPQGFDIEAMQEFQHLQAV